LHVQNCVLSQYTFFSTYTHVQQNPTVTHIHDLSSHFHIYN
jgi:hypothetical protein